MSTKGSYGTRKYLLNTSVCLFICLFQELSSLLSLCACPIRIHKKRARLTRREFHSKFQSKENVLFVLARQMEKQHQHGLRAVKHLYIC